MKAPLYGYDKATSEAANRPGQPQSVCSVACTWLVERQTRNEGRCGNAGETRAQFERSLLLVLRNASSRQYGGDEWNNWNKVMRDSLIKAQETEGHSAGSWYIEKGAHHQQGGRLYCTALSTMILEVYYRHMPLYSEKSSDDKFEF